MQSKPTVSAKASPSAELNILQEMLRLLRVVHRRRRMVILAVLLSAALGALYFCTTPRIYQSHASLLVQQNQPETWSKQGGDMMVKDLMDTYRSMLSSDVVLENALATLPAEARVDLTSVPVSKHLDTLRRNLSVTVVRKTNILEVTYCSKSPRAAAMVVDGIVSAYLKFMDKLHKSNAHDMLEILTRERAGLENELGAKEHELLTLKQQIGDVVIREGDNYVSMMAKGLEGDFELLRKARGQRLEAESLATAIENAVRNGEELRQFALTLMTAGGSDEMEKRLGPDSATLSRVREQLLQDMADLRSAQEHYGPAHSKVRQLADKIQLAENFLHNADLGSGAQALGSNREEMGEVLQRMARQRYQAALEYERLTSDSYEQKKLVAMNIQNNMARLEILNRDLNRMYKSLDLLTEQTKGIEIVKDNGVLSTAVLSTPEVPQAPIKPSLSLVAILSLLTGLGSGAVLACLVDVLDDRFGSPEELRQQLGGLPILAMIRRLESLEEDGLGGVYAYVRPNDVGTEGFRTLRTALALVGDGIQTVSVTSSEAGDGKTTVVANLAVAVAQSAKKTLLIDADIRRPRLTPMLGLKGLPGLTTILRQTAPVTDGVAQMVSSSLMPGLDVIPSGPRATNAAELLTSERLPELLAWAESKYDCIFIDSPPAFVSDVAVIGRLADGLVLVIRPDKNQRRVVIRTVETLSTLGINTLGLVLNHFTSEESKYSYDDDYRYDYGYGHDDVRENDVRENAEIDNEDFEPQPVPIVRRSA
jgi:capsular exopolysaccharide synthesis family protein